MLAVATSHAPPKHAAAASSQAGASAWRPAGNTGECGRSFRDMVGDLAAGVEAVPPSRSDAPAASPVDGRAAGSRPAPAEAATAAAPSLSATSPISGSQVAADTASSKSPAGGKDPVARGTGNAGDPNPPAPDTSGMVSAALAMLETQQVAAGARMAGNPSGDAKPGGSRTGPAVASSEGVPGPALGASSPSEPGKASQVGGGPAQDLDAGDASSAIIPAGKADLKTASAVLPDANGHASPAATPAAGAPASVHATASSSDGAPISASADAPAAAFTATLPTPPPTEMAGGQLINGAPVGAAGGTNAAGSGSAQAGAAASSAATGDPAAATSSLIALPPATAVTDDTGTAIRVTSGELGTVEVKLGTSDDGTASVTVAADRAETLNVLAADRDQMQSVLAEAGVEPAGRRIEYTLLAADPAPAGTAGQSGGDAGRSGDGGGGRQDGGGRDAHAEPSSPSGARHLSQDATQPRRASEIHYIRRTTVDITA